MNRLSRDGAIVVAITFVGLATPAIVAWAGEPIPGIDVKLGKNHLEAQSTGDESPPSIAYEQVSDVEVTADMKREVGRLELNSDTVEVLSATALAGEITGNWGGDEISESDGASPPRETSIFTGAINGSFSAPGVTNVQQNTGVLSLQQGVVSMAVKLPSGPP